MLHRIKTFFRILFAPFLRRRAGKPKYQAGQYFLVDTYITFCVDDDFGIMFFHGGLITGEGHYDAKAGRNVYRVNLHPDGTLDHCLYPPHVDFFEDQMIPCTKEQFDDAMIDMIDDGRVVTSAEFHRRAQERAAQRAAEYVSDHAEEIWPAPDYPTADQIASQEEFEESLRALKRTAAAKKAWKTRRAKAARLKTLRVAARPRRRS